MNRKKTEAENNKLRLTVDDLTGKQSVRATFRLSRQLIELLTVIAGQLGIKQKSLFDQLVENAAILKQVTVEAQDYSAADGDRHQKTFVISRKSLLLLNEIAKERQLSRDVLVEAYIKQLLPVIETELEKHKGRKILLEEMKEYLRRGKELLINTEKRLGKNDLAYEMLKKQVDLVQKNVSALQNIVDRGMPMEEW